MFMNFLPFDIKGSFIITMIKRAFYEILTDQVPLGEVLPYSCTYQSYTPKELMILLYISFHIFLSFLSSCKCIANTGKLYVIYYYNYRQFFFILNPIKGRTKISLLVFSILNRSRNLIKYYFFPIYIIFFLKCSVILTLLNFLSKKIHIQTKL